MNTHIQSLKVWLKFILLWLKYSIFSRGLFLLAHPVLSDNVVSGNKLIEDAAMFEVMTF